MDAACARKTFCHPVSIFTHLRFQDTFQVSYSLSLKHSGTFEQSVTLPTVVNFAVFVLTLKLVEHLEEIDTTLVLFRTTGVI